MHQRLMATDYTPSGLSRVKVKAFVATSKILKGTRILPESPVFKVPGLATNAQLVESLIIEKLKSLSKDKQRAIFSLHNAHASTARSLAL